VIRSRAEAPRGASRRSHAALPSSTWRGPIDELRREQPADDPPARPRLGRLPLPRRIAVILGTAILAGAALAPSLLVTPANAGFLAVTITAKIHDGQHATVALTEALGTTVHLSVKVTGVATRSVPTGYVQVERTEGCFGDPEVLQTTKVKLGSGGAVDVVGSAYRTPRPSWIYFKVRYLGSGIFAPATSAGCWSVNVAAFPTLSYTVHDAGHDALATSEIPIGTAIHPRVKVSGDWGTPTGFVRARLYWDEAFGTPCTGTYKEVSWTQLTNGVADLPASWTSPIARKGYIWAQYSIDVDAEGYASNDGACVPIWFKDQASLATAVVDLQGAPVTKVDVGAEVRLTAALAGEYGVPGDEVRFRLWNSSSCSGDPAVSRTVSIDGAGKASTQLTMAKAGTKAYRVLYFGNVYYLRRSSACKTFTVGSAPSPTSRPPATPRPTAAQPTPEPEATASSEPTPAPSGSAGSSPAAETLGPPTIDPSAPTGSASPPPALASPAGGSDVPAAGATAPASPVPASSVGGPGDSGASVGLVVLLGIGLLIVGLFAGLALGRRRRADPSG
jgi:hypothetical protein